MHLIPSAIAPTPSLHLARSVASSTLNPIIFIFSSTCFFHVCFGRPLCCYVVMKSKDVFLDCLISFSILLKCVLLLVINDRTDFEACRPFPRGHSELCRADSEFLSFKVKSATYFSQM